MREGGDFLLLCRIFMFESLDACLGFVVLSIGRFRVEPESLNFGLKLSATRAKDREACYVP